MLLVVPFVALALMTTAFARRLGWRDGFLLAFTGMALLWWSSATLLSPFEAFALPGILAHYVVAGAVSTAALVRWGLPTLPPLRHAWRSAWLGALVVTCAVLLLIAVNVAPTNYDSLIYHLPKMAQWIQNEEVGPFMTQVVPQIYLPPLAEIGLAHFFVLGGTLWVLNLVQFLASLVTMVGASVIARNIGLDGRGQVIAAGLIGLAPIAVSEAITTQNDYVATALVVVVYAVASRSSWSVHPGWVLVAALAAGLALCTKPTGALIALPACVWALAHLRRTDWRRAAGIAVAGAAIAVVVNVQWMADNQRLFDSPVGPKVPTMAETTEPGLTTTDHSVAVTVGNMVRNAGSVLATPWQSVNDRIHDGLAGAMSAVGINPDDPEALHGSANWYVVNLMTEDQTGSTIQLLVLLGAFAYCLVVARARRSTWPLMVCLLIGYVAFCALLRWQPFGTRLLLPALAVGCVLAAAWVVRWPRLLQLALLALVLVQAFPLVAQQPQRPLAGELSVFDHTQSEELIRVVSPALLSRFEDYAEFLTREPGARIGFQADMANVEFPMWYLLKEADPTVEIGYTEGVGPGRPPEYWQATLAYYEILAYERPEDWARDGYASK